MKTRSALIGWMVAMVLAAVGGGEAVGQSCWEWTQVSPTAADSAAMAYDSTRKVSVLFGGNSGYGYAGNLGDTWEWDGQNWARRSTGGPLARYGHAMCFDSGRGVVVMFGGYHSPGNFGDTWEWDGHTWILRSLTGPSARTGHAMAYDPVRGVTVLFGGGNSASTWEWNGASWALRSTFGPGSRSRHAMTYDAVRGKVLLFGGYGTAQGVNPVYFNELWEWDGASGTWSLLTTSGPSARSGHGMAYDTSTGAAVVFGGSIPSVGFTNETWRWSSARQSWTLVNGAAPKARSNCATVYDVARHNVLMFGGRSTLTFGDLWSLKSGSDDWTNEILLPNGQNGYAIAFDSIRGVTVFIGKDESSQPAKTWEWDGMNWKDVFTGGPTPTGAMAFDSHRGVCVIHAAFGQTWEWDGRIWQLRTTSGPPLRELHTMAFDSNRKVTVLFGGTNNNVNGMNDLWEWDGRVWTQRLEAGPPARYAHAMTFDSLRNFVVLHGGRNYVLPVGNTSLPDTWEWDGSTWFLRGGYGLAALSRHTMVFDSVKGVSVVLADTTYPNSKIWEWNGEVWRPRTTSAPELTDRRGFVYDTWRQSFWLFNVSTGGNYWRYGAAPVCPADVNGDGQIDINDLVMLIGAWGPCPVNVACPADINGDGFVNTVDLLRLIADWNN